MKRILCIWLALVLAFGNISAFAQAPRPRVRVQGKTLKGSGYIISDISFVPLRDVCRELGYEVQWIESTRSVLVHKDSRYIYLTENKNTAAVKGDEIALGGRCIIINDTFYVPSRGLAKGLGIDVHWENTSRTVVFGQKQAASYTPDELYWLSRIISAEAQGESMEGMLAVGNVVLNRVASPLFPNTIYGVIFDTNFGVQFTPVANGTIYSAPTSKSIEAARMCLEGYGSAQNCLYFFNPAISSAHHWIVNNRVYCFSIGNHDFYY